MVLFEEVGKQDHARLCTADHLKTKSDGGSNHFNNIVAACNVCNGTRKNLHLKDWLHRVKFRLEKAGNPQWFDVILSELKIRGISIDIGQPGNGPNTTKSCSPPLTELKAAPE